MGVFNSGAAFVICRGWLPNNRYHFAGPNNEDYGIVLPVFPAACLSCLLRFFLSFFRSLFLRLDRKAKREAKSRLNSHEFLMEQHARQRRSTCFSVDLHFTKDLGSCIAGKCSSWSDSINCFLGGPYCQKDFGHAKMKRNAKKQLQTWAAK